MEDLNIALLIDSDNVSPRYISGILSELSKYGKITIRRMYGDWSQDRLHSWMKCSSRFSLTPVMQPNNTPGKNASDIGLIIDAMDILYTGDVQGFCLVSSDGDFNKLATRLREAGKFVIGMGEKKTPESFRASCERFIFLDVIESEDPPAKRGADLYGASGSQSYGSDPYQTNASDSASGRGTSASRRKRAAVSEPALPYKGASGTSLPAVPSVRVAPLPKVAGQDLVARLGPTVIRVLRAPLGRLREQEALARVVARPFDRCRCMGILLGHQAGGLLRPLCTRGVAARVHLVHQRRAQPRATCKRDYSGQRPD